MRRRKAWYYRHEPRPGVSVIGDRLTQEVQSLRDEIKRKHEDTNQTIEKMFAELSNVKTDRNLLAGLFVEIARCLNQDATPRGGVKGSTVDGR